MSLVIAPVMTWSDILSTKLKLVGNIIRNISFILPVCRCKNIASCFLTSQRTASLQAKGTYIRKEQSGLTILG